MSLLTTGFSLVKKLFTNFTGDKGKVIENQTEIRKMELQDAPKSYLRLWVCVVGWVLSVALAWEMIVRPVIVTYFPEARVPDSMLDEILSILAGMLGLA